MEAAWSSVWISGPNAPRLALPAPASLVEQHAQTLATTQLAMSRHKSATPCTGPVRCLHCDDKERQRFRSRPSGGQSPRLQDQPKASCVFSNVGLGIAEIGSSRASDLIAHGSALGHTATAFTACLATATDHCIYKDGTTRGAASEAHDLCKHARWCTSHCDETTTDTTTCAIVTCSVFGRATAITSPEGFSRRPRQVRGFRSFCRRIVAKISP